MKILIRKAHLSLWLRWAKNKKTILHWHIYPVWHNAFSQLKKIENSWQYTFVDLIGCTLCHKFLKSLNKCFNFYIELNLLTTEPRATMISNFNRSFFISLASTSNTYLMLPTTVWRKRKHQNNNISYSRTHCHYHDINPSMYSILCPGCPTC